MPSAAISCPKHGANEPCQSIKCAAAARRRGHAWRALGGAAVRGRSASSLPLAERYPDPPAGAALVVLPCAPTRWQASNWLGQCPVSIGLGVAVLAGTAGEPRQNRQHLEIAALSCPVLGFSSDASRDARARARERMRAYMCTRNTRTTEPTLYILYNHRVNGSIAVLARFWPEPALHCASPSPDKWRNINILVGGYGENARSHARLALVKGRKGGRAAKTFRPGASAARPVDRRGARDGLELGGMVDQAVRIRRDRPAASSWSARLGRVLGVQGRNGGFLRVSAGAHRHVGTGMLEQTAQTSRKQPFIERRRQLRRLSPCGAAPVRRLGWAVPIEGGLASPAAPIEGGGPPSAARLNPRPFAHAIFLNSDRASIALSHAGHVPPLDGRQTSGRDTGSGEGSAILGAAKYSAGRGFSGGLEVRRSSETSEGSAHVN